MEPFKPHKPKPIKNPVLPKPKNDKPRLEPSIKTTRSITIDPLDDSPVRVGNKVVDRSKTSEPKLKIPSRSKIVINLTPKISSTNSEVPYTDGDGVSYTHFKLSDDGKWVSTKVVHNPKRSDKNTFDPEQHKGFISFEHPRTGELTRYFVQTSGSNLVRESIEEKIVIECSDHGSILTGSNPFYSRSTGLLEHLSEFDLSGLDNQLLLNTVDHLKETISSGSDFTGSLFGLFEELNYLTHSMMDVEVGVMCDDVLVEILRSR